MAQTINGVTFFNCNTDGHQWRAAGFRFHNSAVPVGKRQCAVCARVEDAAQGEDRDQLAKASIELAHQVLPSLKLGVNQAHTIAQPVTDVLNGHAYETLPCGFVNVRSLGSTKERRYRVTRTVNTLVLFRVE